jgi:hypothetical protein
MRLCNVRCLRGSKGSIRGILSLGKQPVVIFPRSALYGYVEIVSFLRNEKGVIKFSHVNAPLSTLRSHPFFSLEALLFSLRCVVLVVFRIQAFKNSFIRYRNFLFPPATGKSIYS